MMKKMAKRTVIKMNDFVNEVFEALKFKHKCLRCEYEWKSFLEKPKVCSRCKSHFYMKRSRNYHVKTKTDRQTVVR